jgi:hypothetical protein
MNTCKLCSEPLGHPAIPSNPYTHYCYKCKTCTECKELVSTEDVAFYLKYYKDGGFPALTHCACMVPSLYESLKNRSVSISEKELDIINAAHLMVRPNIELSIDSNIKEAEIAGITWFNQLATLDEKFLALRRIETLAATCSLLLKKEPGSKTIRIDLNAASVERFRAPSKQDIKYLKCTKCGQKFPELDLSPHFKDCKGAPPKTAAASAKRKQSNFEKSIDLYLKYKLPLNTAIVTTTGQFKEQGDIVSRDEIINLVMEKLDKTAAEANLYVEEELKELVLQ